MLRPAFFGFIVLGLLAIQASGLKQQSVQSSSPTPQQTPAPDQRVCDCEELAHCHIEQLKKDQHLLSSCRQECGSTIFLKPTLQKVVHCYDDYERGTLEDDSQRRQCIEGMGIRHCLSPESPHPQTVIINTTEFLHSGTKKKGNRKFSYPDSVKLLNSCIKTCVKNQGVVQFNPDGTVLKAEKPAKNNGNGEKNHKNGKEYSLCASQLGCQLAPVDKKLEKQASKLCKFQSAPHENHDSKLCACLEDALGQNLRCVEETSPPESCSSHATSCSESRQTGSRN